MRRSALISTLLLGFFLITGQPAVADHIDAIYEVTAENSAGVTFTGCMRFNTPSPGNLTIDAFITGGPTTSWLLTYRHQDLDTNLNTFMAVTNGDVTNGELMVFGRFFGSIKFDRFKGPTKNQRVEGQAVHEDGTTSTFSGEAVLTCP